MAELTSGTVSAGQNRLPATRAGGDAETSLPAASRAYSRRIFLPSLPDNFPEMLKEQERRIMVVTPEKVLLNLNVRRAVPRDS